MPRSRKVVFSASALTDLDSLLAWYTERQVPDVGRRLLEEIVGRAESLLHHPDMGRMVPEFGVAALRELIHPPFRIVYRREADEIQIVRVWRSERILVVPPDTHA